MQLDYGALNQTHLILSFTSQQMIAISYALHAVTCHVATCTGRQMIHTNFCRTDNAVFMTQMELNRGTSTSRRSAVQSLYYSHCNKT